MGLFCTIGFSLWELWSLEAFCNSLSKTQLTVPGTSRTTLDLEELHGQYFRPDWYIWGTPPTSWLCFMPPLIWHTCCLAPEAPSWLTILQGDSGHRIQAGFFLVGWSSSTYAKRAPIITHPCTSCWDCSVPLAACDRLLELLRAAGEAAEKKKCFRDMVSTTGCGAELGRGWHCTYRVALHTHVRGVGSECSHTHSAVGWLLLPGGGKM